MELKRDLGEAVESGARTKEGVRETPMEERELAEHVDANESESDDARAVRKEVLEGTLKETPQIELNRVAGREREDAEVREVEQEVPGCHIERECYLRDRDGKPVIDPETGQARRVDIAAIETKEGQKRVVKLVEVTSETAPKSSQMEKEARIREAGGNYIQDRRTGELVYCDCKTQIRRRA